VELWKSGQADSSRGTAFGWKLGVSSDTKTCLHTELFSLGIEPPNA